MSAAADPAEGQKTFAAVDCTFQAAADDAVGLPNHQANMYLVITELWTAAEL